MIVVPAHSTKPAPHVPPQNPAAWDLWRGCVCFLPLWEGAGQRLVDLSGHGQGVSTIDGTYSWDSHRGLVFDGSTTGAAINASAELIDLPTTYNMTAAAYMRPGAAKSGCAAFCWSGEDDVIFNVNDRNAGSGGLRLFWRDLGSNIINETGADQDGIWQLLTFVSRAANDHRVYRNADLIGSSSNTGTAGPFDDLFLGYNGTAAYCPGCVASFMVWNRALSPDEIATLAADPFCMIRPQEEVPIWLPSAPPAGATGAMFKGTELGNPLMRGMIHVT